MKTGGNLDRPTTRTSLFLGFGLTLGLWLFAGYYFTQRVADVGRQSDAINRRYMHSQELLSTVRTQVLLGAVYVRDALLDPNPAATAEYRSQLEGALAQVDQALSQYGADSRPTVRVRPDRAAAPPDRRLPHHRHRGPHH